jgi:hypothetical protein
MLARLRILKGATALLYFGPLLAGLAGYGVGMLPPFVLIFLLWQVVVRPQHWLGSGVDWLSASGLSTILTQIILQTIFVTALFAVGRGVGGVAGFLPVFHSSLPLVLSFISIPICRLVWDADKAAADGIFLDPDSDDALISRAAAVAASDVTPLMALPDDAPAANVAPLLADLLEDDAGPERLIALRNALATAARSHAALRRSLVLWATEPEVVAPGYFCNAVAVAFDVTGRNPDLLRLFLPRALALISAFPQRAPDFPAVASLRQAAAAGLTMSPNADLPADLRADLADGLAALSRAVDAALRESPSASRPELDGLHHDDAGQTSPHAA